MKYFQVFKIIKITTNFLLILLISLTNFGCKRNNFKNEKNQLFKKNEDYLISEKCATEIAKHIDINDLNSSKNPIAFNNDSFQLFINKTILSQYTVLDTNNLPAFYVFNYVDNGGWLILSGDARHEPILAFNTEGSFSEDENIPDGLALWLDKTIDNIEKIRDLSYDNTNNGIQGWYQFLNDYNIQTYLLNYLPPSLNNPNSVILCPNYYYKKGPLLPSEWGQGCTFNDNLNSCSNSYNCNKFPTGCVATATGQIMRYWKQPSSIWNFNIMQLKYGNTGVQSLLQNIGNNVSMNYNCNGSSAQTEESKKALKNTYNYSTADYVDYDMSRVISDVYANRPGMLSGCHDRTKQRKKWWKFWQTKYKYDNCHQWCYDGVAFWNECGSYKYHLIHMNWGWQRVDPSSYIQIGNNYNGWYEYNNWNIPGQYNFQYANKMVGNIHP